MPHRPVTPPDNSVDPVRPISPALPMPSRISNATFRERMDAIQQFAYEAASGMDHKGPGKRLLEEVAGDIANLLHNSGPNGSYRKLPLES